MGRDLKSEADLLPLLEARLPVQAIDSLVEQFLTGEEAARLILPRHTLDHRRRRRERLSKEESERAIRIVRISSLAEAIFGERKRAHSWLRRTSAAPGDRSRLGCG